MRTFWRALSYSAVAAVNIGSTLLPVWPGRLHVLRPYLPLGVILGAQHVTLLLGVSMLLLAYPAARRQRGATYLLMACLGLAIASNLVKGLDIEEALINTAALGVLWHGRGTVRDIPVRYTPVDLLRLGAALAAIFWLYGRVGDTVLDWLYGMARRGIDSMHRMHSGLIPRYLLTARLPLQARWFEQSQVLLPIFLMCVFLYLSWTSLARIQRDMGDPAELYERFGRSSHNSLAYLARRDDVLTFVDAEGRGAITYRTVGRVALQIGAILAPAEARLEVYAAFCAYCRAQGLIPAAVALAQDELPAARRAGMRTLTIGTEAVVDVATFAIEGLSKKMRWAHRNLSKRGYTVRLVTANAVTPGERAALARLDAQWRALRGGQLHGCCMTLGRFPTVDDSECLVALASDAAGDAVAYLTLLPGGEGYYSLDLTRRASDAPNATMEFLLMETLAQLRARGAATVSLNFSTFSRVAQVPGGEALLNVLGAAVQLHSLETFNNKFRPAWVSRYLAYPSRASLPDVVYAILTVEGVNHMAVNALARAMRRPLTALTALAHQPALQQDGVHTP